MHLLEIVLDMYLLTDGKRSPQSLNFVATQRNDFTKALYSPRWSKENFLRLAKILVDSKPSLASYGNACNKVGHKVVNSLIKANIVSAF